MATAATAYSMAFLMAAAAAMLTAAAMSSATAAHFILWGNSLAFARTDQANYTVCVH